MTEDDARDWIGSRHGPSVVELLAQFAALVVDQNNRQNLIAPSTIMSIWARHIVDSAQLVRWDRPGVWLDIGSGGGFPGIVIAALRRDPVVLLEPRRKRAQFLQDVAARLSLNNVTVMPRRVEAADVISDVISARAVGSTSTILAAARHCAIAETRWVLPRGRMERDDLQQISSSWHGVFHVERSLTSPESGILILDGIPQK